MASKSVNCQFCEESDSVIWYCHSCDINLCDACNTKIHTKLEELSQHKVVLLEQGEINEDSENITKVDLKKIGCSKHMDQKCVTYCLNCDKSLCSSCLIQPFQYEELNKVYEEKCFLLKDLKSKIDECYPFFEEKADDFRKMDDGEVVKHNEIKEKISNRKNEVKDFVSQEALKLEEFMKEIWDTENNPVITERKRLCQIEQELRARKNIIDEVIEKLKPDSVFYIVENISREIPEESALDIKPPDLIYIEGKERFTTEILGSVIKIPEVVLVQTFEVNSFIINGLVSLNDDICVMHSKSRKSAQKFKYFTISGSKFVTVKDITDNKFDFNKKANMTNYKGEIVLSNMRLIKDSGILENLSLPFTSDELNFHGIHSDNYYTFTVGFTHEILSKDRHKTESAGILELEINHRNEICKKRRIEWNSSEFRTLFTLPEKITTSINGYIYVIDRLNSKRGRVVAIEKWGQPKWAYNGHPSINSGNDFSPNDIITTPSGMVLVAEENTNAIHVLSKNGQFICNCISGSGITEPGSICFNKKGQLMIGSNKKEQFMFSSSQKVHSVTDSSYFRYSGEASLHIVKFVE